MKYSQCNTVKEKEGFIQSIVSYKGLYGRKWIAILLYKVVLQLLPVLMFLKWDWQNGFDYEQFISWIEELRDNSNHLLVFALICIYIGAVVLSFIIGVAVFDKEYYFGFTRRLILQWHESDENNASPMHLQKFYGSFLWSRETVACLIAQGLVFDICEIVLCFTGFERQ